MGLDRLISDVIDNQTQELHNEINKLNDIILELKRKIDFYEGELHRRGYAIQKEE